MLELIWKRQRGLPNGVKTKHTPLNETGLQGCKKHETHPWIWSKWTQRLDRLI
jgi:hypothetical protein